MEIKFVDLKKNFENIKNEVLENVNDLFNKCDFISGGSVKKFEENFAKYLGVKHFIGCANGTDALEIAVKMLDLEKDDEIIVQGNTYIATCLGVLNNNIKLVLCDIDENTYQISAEKLESKITDKTKAIIIVHLYGLMPDMDKIMDLVKKHDLYLIEDCAQAHGAKWKGQMAGTFGHISCFSFYPGKNLGAYGDGGGIATNDDLLNERIRLTCNLGCKIKYHHELIGRNSRLDTLQASFLNTKLKYLDDWNNMRRSNAELYCKLLKDVGDIELPKIYESCEPVYHLFVIKTKYRDQLQKHLKDNKIDALIHYPISICETEAMEKYNFDKNELSNCIHNSHEILSLPMYPELEICEIKYICDKINDFFLTNNLLNIKSIKTCNKSGILNCINNIQFDTKRLFYIKNMEEKCKRGLHVNLNFDEVLVVVKGKIQLKLINKELVEKCVELNEDDIYYIPRLHWLEFDILEKNTIILCLTNKIKEESISEHDFEKFILLSSGNIIKEQSM
jgi:dTDP-4-amino-4,6-dideoxygalactose transaminase